MAEITHEQRLEQYWGFREAFPLESLNTMPLEKYTNLNRSDSFCYWLETRTGDLGSVKGGSSYKFGIYKYDKVPNEGTVIHDEEYAWYRKLGATRNEAYDIIRNAVVEIANAAHTGDLHTIETNNIIGDAVKWKIAFLYSDFKIVNIYAKDMISIAATSMGMANADKASMEEVQRYLLARQDCEDMLDYGDKVWGLYEEHRNDIRYKNVWFWGGDERTFKLDTLSCGESISKHVRDFSNFTKKEELTKAYQKALGNNDFRVPYAYWQFMKDVKVGDIVVVCSNGSYSKDGKNHHKLHGWGIFTSDLINDVESNAPLQREVEWKQKFETPIEENIIRNALFFFGTNNKQAMAIKTLLGLVDKVIDIKELLRKFYTENNIEKVYNDRVALDGKGPSVWLWAPGEGASEWDSLRNSEEMALGWDFLGDYSQYQTNEELDAALKANEEYKTTKTDQASFMVKSFRDDVKPGDLVLVKGGLYKILGWGYVTSDYYFSPEASTLKSRRKAKWMLNKTVQVGKRKSTGEDRLLPQKSLTEISKYPVMVSEILELFKEEDKMDAVNPSSIVLDAAKLLDNAGQIILQGAPGCGKTYITTELAVYLCNGKVPATREALKEEYKRLQTDKRIGFTTFHQSLDYEEFVEGLKPKTSFTGEMTFEVKPGIFKRMCTEAKANPDKKYVLIIDEINRANISKVLGELITLLEKSKRMGNDDEFSVTLPYSGEEFGVPDNLYVVGTMNTADRSIGYIDYAIRRRFAFMTLESDPYVIISYYGDKGELVNMERNLYNEVRTIIQHNLADDFDFQDVMIGHSYFLAPTLDDYRMNLEYKIRPLLKEYLRDGIIVERGSVKEAIEKLGKE